jgi:hypothetical protein
MLLKGNPRALNFDLACAAVLQKYDLERDESQRKFQAAMWGVELKDGPTKTPKSVPSNGQKQTMTAQDIMRNYKK